MSAQFVRPRSLSVRLFIGLSVGLIGLIGGARGDLITHGGTTIDITFVPVPAAGGVANPADTHGTGYGSVGYDYRIGKYEVTAGQYAAFLNAAAASDPNGLYNADMDNNAMGSQITRVGSDGNYTYNFSGAPSGTASDWENRPVNYVSWYDAARFANWLTTGDTETGVYVFSGGVFQSITDRAAAATTYGTVYIIPTEDEWYKAAYYDPGTGVYYDYPTSSDTAPGRDMSEGTNPGNNANYYDGISYLLGSPYYRTEVGEFGLSISPFGTFDQGGNVWEWNETLIFGARGLRGGSFGTGGGISSLRADNRGNLTPPSEDVTIGFRVASFSPTVIPEPGSLGLLTVALTGLAARRRRVKRSILRKEWVMEKIPEPATLSLLALGGLLLCKKKYTKLRRGNEPVVTVAAVTARHILERMDGTMKRNILIASVLFLCMGLRTEAALIEITDSGSPGGINNVTYDTAAGLEWLDLTASLNISYDTITAQFVSGGAFEGWRHATRAEVHDLFVNSANLTLGQLAVVDPLAVQFIGLVGITQSNSLPNATAARGLYNDDTSGTLANYSGAAYAVFGYPTIVNTAYTEVSILDDQPFPKDVTPSGSMGHWLVRTAAIPEPATLALLALGSVMISRTSKRKRQKQCNPSWRCCGDRPGTL